MVVHVCECSIGFSQNNNLANTRYGNAYFGVEFMDSVETYADQQAVANRRDVQDPLGYHKS